MLYREQDDVLGLTDPASTLLVDQRTGKTGARLVQHAHYVVFQVAEGGEVIPLERGRDCR